MELIISMYLKSLKYFDYFLPRNIPAHLFTDQFLCYLHGRWCKENSMKLLAVEEPSEAQYLFTEEHGNAISTEMMLPVPLSGLGPAARTNNTLCYIWTALHLSAALEWIPKASRWIVKLQFINND